MGDSNVRQGSVVPSLRRTWESESPDVPDVCWRVVWDAGCPCVSCGQVHGRQCSAYPACAAVNLTMGNCCPNNNRHWTGNGRNREAARAVSRWVTCKYYFRGHPILQQMKSNRHCLNWGACGQVWDSSLKICGVLLWIFWYWDLFVWRPALHRHCIVS